MHDIDAELRTKAGQLWKMIIIMMMVMVMMVMIEMMVMVIKHTF